MYFDFNSSCRLLFFRNFVHSFITFGDLKKKHTPGLPYLLSSRSTPPGQSIGWSHPSKSFVRSCKMEITLATIFFLKIYTCIWTFCGCDLQTSHYRSLSTPRHFQSRLTLVQRFPFFFPYFLCVCSCMTHVVCSSCWSRLQLDWCDRVCSAGCGPPGHSGMCSIACQGSAQFTALSTSLTPKLTTKTKLTVTYKRLIATMTFSRSWIPSFVLYIVIGNPNVFRSVGFSISKICFNFLEKTIT